VLTGADAVINLNGRNIGEGRWTAQHKEELRSSRIRSTETLARAIATAATPPPLLINASAVGYYGDRGEELLDEDSPAGTASSPSSPGTGSGRLSPLRQIAPGWCSSGSPWWLAAAAPWSGCCCLSGSAPAARSAPGRQWWPWIAMEDVIGVVRFLLEQPAADGPLNLAPAGDPLRRLHEVPRTVLARRACSAAGGGGPPDDGEMADALLLASARVRPAALARLGYSFRVPDLEAAIRHAID